MLDGGKLYEAKLLGQMDYTYAPISVIVFIPFALMSFDAARIVWSIVGWAAVVGLLGETLRLPDWARNTSPLRAVGNLPVDDPDAWVLVGMAVIAAVLVLASQAAFTRRDVLG